MSVYIEGDGTTSGTILAATIRTNWRVTALAAYNEGSDELRTGLMWIDYDLGASAALFAGTQYIIRLQYGYERLVASCSYRLLRSWFNREREPSGR